MTQTKTTRRLVYIAGPYRASTPYQVERNIRAAEDLGLIVAYAGGVPVIPHSMFRYFDGLLTDQYWLEATQTLMLECDRMVMLPGWETSEGSRAERERWDRERWAEPDVFFVQDGFDVHIPSLLRGDVTVEELYPELAAYVHR